MKKVLYGFAMATAVALASCGNTTKPAVIENDSTEITEAEKPVSEDAVFSQVSKMYERLNQMGESGEIDLGKLEQEFCTKYYLDLKERIAQYDENATGDMRFMGDEGYHWLLGQALPLTIQDLNAQILSDNEAIAQIRFDGGDEDDPCGVAHVDTNIQADDDDHNDSDDANDSGRADRSVLAVYEETENERDHDEQNGRHSGGRRAGDFANGDERLVGACEGVADNVGEGGDDQDENEKCKD